MQVELELRSKCVAVDGLSRGHITIRGSTGVCTSKNHQPDHSMMIFLSVPLLLDGIGEFITNRQPVYNFVGVDSSFQFKLTKTKHEQISFVYDKREISTLATAELIQAVWEGVNSFMSTYGEQLDATDIALEDLVASMEKFSAHFR